MHLGIRALLDFYRRHSEEDALVLVTIIATEGSTYRKPGAMMLISPGGRYEGMISGGCLEGDLLQHADTVFASGEAAFVTYDMHADDELVWSLGLGCDGVIHLMLQRLDREDDFGFLRQLEASREARKAALLALVTHPESGLPCGSFALLDQAGTVAGAPQLLNALRTHTRPWPSWRTHPARLDSAGGQADTLLINIPAATRILICGAGPDAVPLAGALAELDWDVVVVDHRPAFAKAGRFPSSCAVIRSRPDKLGDTIDLSELDGVVIMSHHLENDCEYLRQVSAHEIGYIGVLGPRARRDRLREMAACCDLKIHGPAGLDIGAELPSAIALSIAAEIHAVLNRRNGLSLTARIDEES